MKLEMFRNGIWDMLRTLSDDLDHFYRPLGEKYSLTMIQMRILVEIAEEGEQTIGNLSRAIGLTAGNASSMCKRLEREGYLGRRRDRRDERVVQLTLTEKGASAVSDVDEYVRSNFGEILTKWTEEDLLEIFNGLQKLSCLFEDLQKVSLPDSLIRPKGRESANFLIEAGNNIDE